MQKGETAEVFSYYKNDNGFNSDFIGRRYKFVVKFAFFQEIRTSE
jgi:hypothetical protein